MPQLPDSKSLGNAVRCLVFDLDDTLFLERDYVRSGLKAAARWANRELDVPNLFELTWRCFESGGRGQIFDRALKQAGIVPDALVVAQLVAIYRGHEPAIDLLHDAQRCVESLLGRVMLGVITDGPVISQQIKARVLRVADWSQVTVFTSQLGEGFGKPHPRAFELVERATTAVGSECVYVADNPAKDFAGAKSLGWFTVRIRRPESLHASVPAEHDVDLEISDLSGLDSFFASVGAVAIEETKLRAPHRLPP